MVGGKGGNNKQKKEIQLCQVCSGAEISQPHPSAQQQQQQGKEGKYRCPNCHIRYCSVACFKQHKEIGPCEKQERPLPSSSHATGAKRSRQVKSRLARPNPMPMIRPMYDRLMFSPLHSTQAFEMNNLLSVDDGGRGGGGGMRRSGNGPPRIDPQILKKEEATEEAFIITQEMKSALQDSKWLKSALQDSTLCRLLSDVHHDPQNRAKKLREAMQQYPDFDGFVDRLLLEIGALKYEEGRLVFS